MQSQSRSGLTLVELLIVLALLSVTLAAVFTFFSFTRGGYKRTDTRSHLMQDMNLATSMISDDIRSASRPNDASNSVFVQEASGALAKGQSISIYKNIYNDEDGSISYIRICYRLDPANKAVLQRGEAVCAEGTPPGDKNPGYAAITLWRDILSGVKYTDESGGDIAIFEDKTMGTENDRRMIQVNLSINSISDPLPKPVEVNMTITSRSKGVPE